MTTPEQVDLVARALFDAFEQHNDDGGYIGDYRFPGAKKGNTTCLDGNWDMDKIAVAVLAVLAGAPKKDADATGEVWDVPQPDVRGQKNISMRRHSPRGAKK